LITNHPRPAIFPSAAFGAKVAKRQTSTRVPSELILPTFSVRLLDQLVVFVGRPGVLIADADWSCYLEWLKALLLDASELRVLVTPGAPPPTSTQRSLLNQAIRFDSIRFAIMFSDPKVLAIVRVMSWFMKSIEPFGARQLQKALEHLGESDITRVRTAIRELGGVLPDAAP